MSKNYLYKILLFIDIFSCAVIFRDPDVTLSAEVGLAMERAKPPLWAIIINWTLNKIQAHHCASAITDDIRRAQIAIKYLETRQQ